MLTRTGRRQMWRLALSNAFLPGQRSVEIHAWLVATPSCRSNCLRCAESVMSDSAGKGMQIGC